MGAKITDQMCSGQPIPWSRYTSTVHSTLTEASQRPSTAASGSMQFGFCLKVQMNCLSRVDLFSSLALKALVANKQKQMTVYCSTIQTVKKPAQNLKEGNKILDKQHFLLIRLKLSLRIYCICGQCNLQSLLRPLCWWCILYYFYENKLVPLKPTMHRI